MKVNLIHSDRPTIMGVLNVTPDSFHDGGQFNSVDKALRQVERMVSEGADIIDIGGESTRPGGMPIVSLVEEIERVVPIIEAIAARFNVPLSIDTYKPEVMREAVRLGAVMINDVFALTKPGALQAAVDTKVPVCLMHREPHSVNLAQRPQYDDVIAHVVDYLSERVNVCLQAGITRDQIVIDPGFGFDKTWQHNLVLLRHLDRFKQMNLPILVGLSRKNMDGLTFSLPSEERLMPSIALAVLALSKGASIIRTHDVLETRRACDMAYRIEFESVNEEHPSELVETQ